MNTEPKKRVTPANQNLKLQKNHAGFNHRHADGQAFSWMLAIQKNHQEYPTDQVRSSGQ